uniref:Uncharacterized protein n=1 Tax=Opuntia streptacantha TaxID=393608 RepID=A0A7C9DFJ0_OPUST
MQSFIPSPLIFAHKNTNILRIMLLWAVLYNIYSLIVLSHVEYSVACWASDMKAAVWILAPTELRADAAVSPRAEKRRTEIDRATRRHCSVEKQPAARELAAWGGSTRA